MKVIVLGGCGFIGSHVVDQLLRDGHIVRVFDRQKEQFRSPLTGVDYRIGNFGDRMALIDALSGMDAVVHLVSTTFPGTADLDPKTDVQDNLSGSIVLLDSMVSLGISRIVFLSSGGTVYGIPQSVPISEHHPLRPISSYGIVKVAVENYLEMYRRTRGILPTIIRASNPYGPRQGHKGVQGVINTFLARSLSGDPIEVWGDGSVVRDYVHVADIGDLCARALRSGKIGTYNAGSGVGTSVNEIIDIVRDVTRRSIVPIYKPARALDVPISILDVSKAATDFLWKPRATLHAGIAETWKWMQGNASI